MSEEIRSHCRVCGREIYYHELNGYWKHCGTNVPRHIPQPPAHLESVRPKTLANKIKEQEECLRELACYLGVGGYNDLNLSEFDPKKYLERIKQGIEDFIETEIQRTK